MAEGSMTQKTLLALGGSRLLLPIIDAAHELGHRVVTCDYLPDNYAHQFADDYRNVSIVDREAVLATARDLQADGIVSFATDPGVVAASYAAEQLNLPRQVSTEAAVTLQTKHLFREFLTQNGFPSPKAWHIDDLDQVDNLTDEVELPVIVKPADAAGSKGVTRVDDARSLRDAAAYALSFSLSSTCIIESFIATDQPQRSAEAFVIGGQFATIHFMDQLFDITGPNPYAPAGNVLPSTMTDAALTRVTADLQHIARLLGFGTGLYNIEVRVATDGTPYIVEISPRGGGNKLAEFIRTATGQDLIRSTVQAAVGDQLTTFAWSSTSGVWVQQVLFSREAGVVDRVVFDNEVTPRLHDLDVWVNNGDHISAFTHASFAAGTAILRFPDQPAAERYLQSHDGSANIQLMKR